MFPTWSIWDGRPVAYLLSGICWHFRTPRQCSGVAFKVHLETNIVEVTLARGRQGRLAMINPRKRLSFGFIIGRYLHPRSWAPRPRKMVLKQRPLPFLFGAPVTFQGGRTVSFGGGFFLAVNFFFVCRVFPWLEAWRYSFWLGKVVCWALSLGFSGFPIRLRRTSLVAPSCELLLLGSEIWRSPPETWDL